jgi:hypothetical protein
VPGKLMSGDNENNLSFIYRRDLFGGGSFLEDIETYRVGVYLFNLIHQRR